MTAAVLLLLAPLAQATTGMEASGPNPQIGKGGDFALKLEPGLAIPVGDPQAQAFQLGVGQTIKALWGVSRHVDIGPSGSFTTLPAEAPMTDAGTAWTLGAGARLKRPHDAPYDDALYAISPWLDADALYVRTGGLNRPGFAVAAGLSVPIGDSRTFWIGPFVRYFQIIQGERAGFDSTDAKLVSVGVSLEVGSGVERRREAVVVPAPEPRVVTVNKEIAVCPDRDNDTVPDGVDRCPDVSGPMDSFGCPAYKKLVVKPDKLELKEKLYFAWNQATIQEQSFPVLDEVVQALKDNKNFRVQVEGHSSSEGGGERNQTLSERRAAAVHDYLVAHGIDKERLVSKGFGSAVPIDTNDTVAGRENNRRVEFVVNFIILKDESK